MRRRIFLQFAAPMLGALLGSLGIFLAAPMAWAQAQVKVRRVGWLTGGSPRSHAQLLEAFREGLREHGWTEGKNIVLETRWAEGQMERLPSFAAELVRLAPDVIVTAANPVTLAVKQRTSTIPIVMATGADPVEQGLVKSLARPGGNVTGMTGFFDATPMKMLELAQSLIPRGARVSVLIELKTFLADEQFRRDIQLTAKALDIRVEFVEVSTVDRVRFALATLKTNRPAALVVVAGPMLFSIAREMVRDAEALKIPVIYPFEESVEAGGLMSYAAPLADNYRRAAYYVDRILKGAQPGDLPVEQPTRLFLAVNLKSARALGLQLPRLVMLRADRIIE